MSIEIFCCYAREDQRLLKQLKKRLLPFQRQGLITLWADTDINAGTEWEHEIERHLNTAHMILLLVSPDFMASDYCYSKEMKRALERQDLGEAHVIPILLRPTHWKDTPLAKLQMLPTDNKPVVDRSWTEDEAFYDVIENINSVVRELRIKYALNEANKLSKNSRYEVALVIYDQLIDLEPECAQAYLGKGEMLLALARYEQCLDAFKKAVQVDPGIVDANFCVSKAYALSKVQRYEESLVAYDEAIRRNPRSILLYEEKANTLLHLQRYDEALNVYEHLVRLEPQKAQYYQKKGEILLDLRKYDEALASFDRAILLISDIPLLYEYKGLVLHYLNRIEEALVAYNEAIRLSPDVAFYHAEKGLLLMQLKRPDEALIAYEQAINIDSKVASYHFEKGCILQQLKRDKEALASYEHTIDLDPNLGKAYYNKAIIYERLAQQAYDKAKQLKYFGDKENDVALKVDVFPALSIIVGIFETTIQAKSVMNRLQKKGLRTFEMEIMIPKPLTRFIEYGSLMIETKQFPDINNYLVNVGLPLRKVSLYEKEYKEGRTIVLVRHDVRDLEVLEIIKGRRKM